MATHSPKPISAAMLRARRMRIRAVARTFGFIGQIEYRHVYSPAGGAQYGRGTTKTSDLLTVYAEAFERDADPDDFSLEAIIAHERGHQMLVRHPRIAKRVAGRISDAGEEVLASLLGAMICRAESDKDALIAKAVSELLDHGEQPGIAIERLQELWLLLRGLL